MAGGVPLSRVGGLDAPVLPRSVVNGLRAAVRRRAAENASCERRQQSAADTRRQAYDTVSVSARHGLEALDILRLRQACGATRGDTGGTRLLFLVPAGTAARWCLPGSSCTSGAVAAGTADADWLAAPADDRGDLRPTDPWVLRSALCEAACTLAAGGLAP